MRRRLLLTVLFVLIFLFPGIAAAQTVDGADEGFIFRANGDVTVASGDELGGVVVANGNAVVDGTVTETLWVINGDATVSGTVPGDVIVISGTLHLGPDAAVENVTLINGTLDRADGARITGSLNEEDSLSGFGWGFAVFSIAMWLGVTAMLMLAALVFAALGGRQLTVLGGVLRGNPGMSAIAAVIVWVGLPVLAILSLITIIGIPLGLTILLIVMPALWVLGYLVAGATLGEVIVRALGQRVRPERPLLAAASGVLLLQVVGLIPALGPAVVIIAGMIGAGALVYGIARRPGMPSAEPRTTVAPSLAAQ